MRKKNLFTGKLPMAGLLVNTALVAMLLITSSMPCFAQDVPPPDFQIHSEEGDIIQVSYIKIFAEDDPDRCDICFEVSGMLRSWKSYETRSFGDFFFSPGETGPKCVTTQTDFHYQTYDDERTYRPPEKRGSAFGKKTIIPKSTVVQLSLYKDKPNSELPINILANANLSIRYLLEDEDAGLIWVPIFPGYKVKFLWLVD